MKALITSDTHFHNFPEFATYEHGINSRLVHQLMSLRWMLAIGRKYGCQMFIHLGDVFHTRGKVEPEVVNLVKHTFMEYGEYLEEIQILTGNHDITAEGDMHNTAYILDGQMDEKIQVTTKQESRTLGDLKCVFHPFTSDAFDPEKGSVLFMHQSIFGARYGRPIVKGVHVESLKKYKRVFCGHIHLPQLIGNVEIVGAPYPMNFGDDYVGRVIVYDTDKNTVQSFSNTSHPAFRTVTSLSNINGRDFYRAVLKENPESSTPPNVRVTVEPKVKKLVRVRAKTDRELLSYYVKSISGADPKLVDSGLEILENTK